MMTWYEQVAQSRPSKNKPWYHVLVHTAEHTTYVAEQNFDFEKFLKYDYIYIQKFNVYYL